MLTCGKMRSDIIIIFHLRQTRILQVLDIKLNKLDVMWPVIVRVRINTMYKVDESTKLCVTLFCHRTSTMIKQGPVSIYKAILAGVENAITMIKWS